MKLTDAEKKQLTADYIECKNYSAVARKYGVSRTTVANIVKSDNEICEKLQQKKEENAKNVLEYMGEKGEKVCTLINLYLDELSSPERLEKATISQIATAMGIIIDKFTNIQAESVKDEGVIIMPEVISNE